MHFRYFLLSFFNTFIMYFLPILLLLTFLHLISLILFILCSSLSHFLNFFSILYNLILQLQHLNCYHFILLYGYTVLLYFVELNFFTLFLRCSIFVLSSPHHYYHYFQLFLPFYIFSSIFCRHFLPTIIIKSILFLYYTEIEKYEKLFENVAASQLKFAIRNLVAKTLIEKGDLEKPKFSLDGLSVRIRKGHTCSRTWYLHFFHNMEVAMNKINFVNSLMNDEKNKENDKEIENEKKHRDENRNENTLQKNNYYLPAIKSKNIFLFEKTEEKKIKSYMDKFSFLQYLPLEIDIVGTYTYTYVRDLLYSLSYLSILFYFCYYSSNCILYLYYHFIFNCYQLCCIYFIIYIYSHLIVHKLKKGTERNYCKVAN